ncbi:MAG: caspase family protein [Bacteroidota bacterium]
MKNRYSILLIVVCVFLSFQVSSQNIRLGLPLGHTSLVWDAEYSPDGKYIVTASADKTAKMWESKSGRLIQNFEGHLWGINSAQFSPVCSSDPTGGKYIVTASDDSTAKIWESSSGKILKTLSGHRGYVYSAKFSPDGKNIVTTSKDSTAKIWDTQSGKLLHTFDGTKSFILSFRFSPDGKYFITASKDSSAKVWECSSGKLIKNIQGHTGWYNSVQFSPNGKYVLTACRRDSAQLRECGSWNLIRSFDGKYAEFSTDGKNIVSITDDGTMKIWESSSGKLLNSIDDHVFRFPMITATFSADGKYILTFSEDGTAKIWDSKSGIMVGSSKDNLNMFSKGQFSPDGKSMVFTAKKTAEIRETQSGKLLIKLESQIDPISDARFSADGKYMATSSATAKIWNVSEGKLLRSLKSYSAHIVSAQFSPDGKYIVTSSPDSSAKIWECSSGKLLFNLDVKDDYMKLIEGTNSFAEYSPDGKFIISNAGDGRAKVWESSSGKWMSILDGPTVEYAYAQYSPDGKFIVTTSGMDGMTSLWDAGNGKFLYSFRYRYAKKITARFRPDGKRIVCASGNEVAKGWEPVSGKLLNLSGHKAAVNDAVFSPACMDDPAGGKFIVTASDDHTAKIWDAGSGKILFSLEGHEREVETAQYSPDGKNIVTASDDNTAKIWDAGNGKMINNLTGHTGSLISAQYSPGGKQVVTVSRDGSLILWDAKTGKRMVQEFVFNETDFLSLTSGKYYYGTKKAVSLLYWIIDNTKVYPFEQFDLQYNRPDIVLEKIGLADTMLINSYRKAYYKRLKKMNFEEGMFSPEFHMPETVLQDADKLLANTTEQLLSIKVKVTDSKYNLDRINVWVNEVPLYGTSGIDLRSLKISSIEKEIKMTLSQGMNTIQMSSMNEKGVESMKETYTIRYEPKQEIKRKTYLIAISVAEYKNKEYNLKYAVKDGRDMAKMMAARAGASIDTLFDVNATRENILALKQKLMQTNVDDEVILYVSGHGLLDKNFDFYFATFDMNFTNPAEKGVLYDDLEALLDGIPARNKLLLMDACHSGEVDKENIEVKDKSLTLADGQKGELKTYGYKGVKVKNVDNTNLGLQNSFELMRELFYDLSRSSGAVVISAAAGTGYALESAEWNNGIFTYCILNGLKNWAADKNNDKVVTVSELKEYVSDEVSRMTSGAQKPTSRKELLGNDWKVW